MGEVRDTISDVVAKMATAMAIIILNVFMKVGCFGLFAYYKIN